MKKLFTIFVALSLITLAWTQSPQKISYQAVIRNSSNQLVINQHVGMRISILQGSISGVSVYVETQSATTNTNGLLTVAVGDGTVISGSFSAVDWSAGPYFLKTETDPDGGGSYSITGTSQILSVPYALHSKTADILTGEITESQISDLQNYLTDETDPLFSSWDKSSGISITESQISNLKSYLTAETDPVFLSWDRSTGISITESQISNLKSYLTSESDPVFNGSAAKIITTGNISNWNNAYSWGNHASAGYVPGTRTITINGTSLNLSDNRSWNVGTVTSIATGNGITGGTISTAGTIGLTGQSLALHNLGTNGLITRTAAGTLASRTIIAGNGITVSNGNGVSGNPTIAANFGTTATTVAAGNHTHANATTSASGFMSAADKTKIDGLTTYAVGNAAHGGVVFWVDATGQHGLVCAIFDQSTGIRWDAGTLTWTLANGDGPFAGAMNTAIIIANQGRGDGSLYAARICNQLQMTIGGKTYGDWYLPSKEELNLMFVNRSIISDMCLKLGGSAFNTSTGYYYSSTEYSMDKAWGHAFHSGGYQSVNTKFGKARVRAIRAF